MSKKNGTPAQRPIDPAVLDLDGFTVDLSAWRMGDYMDWEQLLSGENASLTRAVEMMAGVIRRWPFAGDPADTASWRTLDGGDWALCYAAVQKETGNSFRLRIEARLSSAEVRAVGSRANGSRAAHEPGEVDPAT